MSAALAIAVIGVLLCFAADRAALVWVALGLAFMFGVSAAGLGLLVFLLGQGWSGP